MKTASTIRIESDTATPALRELRAKLTPERFASHVGPALANLTRDHLAKLGPNVQGWPTTHFYQKFAGNVRWLPAENGVAVVILPAVVKGRLVSLAQRVFGGTIMPRTAKMLAIPISPASYGKGPGDFQNLFLIITAKGAFLVQRGETVSENTGRTNAGRGLGGHAGRRLRAELRFLFVLRAGVSQAGNRQVLPGHDEFLAAAITAAKGALQ